FMYRDVLRHVAEESGRQPSGARLGLFTGGRGDGSMLGRLVGRTGSAAGNGMDGSVADPHRACPACRVRERYERIYLGVLFDHLGAEEFTRALQSAGGLCLVHLDRASATTRNMRALERLWELQNACMQSLLEELSEFIRKHDYR